LVVTEEGEGGGGHLLRFTRRNHEAGVADGLADPADVGRDGRTAAGHGPMMENGKPSEIEESMTT